MNRKITILAVVALVALSGCMGASTTYNAPPPEIDAEVTEEYNYEHQDTEEININNTIDVESVDEDIEITSWISMYNKDFSTEGVQTDMDVDGPALYAILSTPSVELVGQELNPLVMEPTEEVLDYAAENADDDFEVHEKVDEINATSEATGEDITVEKFDATFYMSEYDMELDGYIMTTVIPTDDAVLVTIGGYPEMMDEEEAIVNLMQNTDSTDDEAVMD